MKWDIKKRDRYTCPFPALPLPLIKDLSSLIPIYYLGHTISIFGIIITMFVILMLITLLGSSVSRFLLYKKDFENQTFILPKLLKYSDQILTDYQILKKSLSPLICLTFFSQGKTFSSCKVTNDDNIHK